MERDIYKKDYIASRLISMGKQVDGYTQIYYKTNENLIDYLDIDFCDKKVFSVLGSSDQVFTARYLEAAEVDAFDTNRLALYYFYLRVWSIKYRVELYPFVFNGDKWVRNLINLVQPESEQEEKALEFFKRHKQDRTHFNRLFYDVDAQPEGQTLYTKADEIWDCVQTPLNFYHLNLFEEFDIGKQYDILLISNILEWARGDKTKLQIAKDNIGRLLSKDGVVICSNLINRTLNDEIELFSDYDFNRTGTTYTYQKR